MAFKMKGFNFPGINQEGNENMADGRSKSSAFQKKDEKETAIEAIGEKAKEAAERGASIGGIEAIGGGKAKTSSHEVKHSKIKRPKGYYKDGKKITKEEYDRLTAVAKRNVSMVGKKKK